MLNRLKKILNYFTGGFSTGLVKIIQHSDTFITGSLPTQKVLRAINLFHFLRSLIFLKY